jgi:hypothetical protein
MGRKGGWGQKNVVSLEAPNKDEQSGKEKSVSAGEIRNQTTTIIAGVGTFFHSSIYARYYLVYNAAPFRILRDHDAFGATSTLSPFTAADDATGCALLLQLPAAEDMAMVEVASRRPPELALATLVTVTVTVWVSGAVLRAPLPCANGLHIILT